LTPSKWAASATAAALASDEDMHVAAERLGGGQRLVGRVLERLVVVLGEEEGRHQGPRREFVILRCPRVARASKDAAETPQPSPFEARCARTSG
jgi:hypothetical protein